MELLARYCDGETAVVHDALCRLEGPVLAIRDYRTGARLAEWPADEVFPVPSRPAELRFGATSRPKGARLAVFGTQAVTMARLMLPALARRQRLEGGRQFRIAGLATLALASVIGAYVVGVPLLASRLVTLVPSEWEARLGTTVAEQVERSLGEGPGFVPCDPDPQSLANSAIARFADAAMEGSGSPFGARVAVIRSEIPNAFALPGGQIYYFSALLESSESADEFAGVLAHEIGHVVHRHSMEQLIATSATGALIGFVLGDLTGTSVAAALGATLIDSSFSREAEREADRFSASVARRLAFRPQGLPDLLERVAGDDDFTRSLALLSTHPLTAERRAALDALGIDQTGLEPAFSSEEWAAIKRMCGPPSRVEAGADPEAEGASSEAGDAKTERKRSTSEGGLQ